MLICWTSGGADQALDGVSRIKDTLNEPIRAAHARKESGAAIKALFSAIFGSRTTGLRAGGRLCVRRFKCDAVIEEVPTSDQK